MSEIAIGNAEASDGPFKRGAMLLIVTIGTLAFIAMLVLGAYAPDLRSGRNGGSHALSNAATGYSGLVRLAQETGRNPRIVRSKAELKTEDLVVITPEHGWTDLSEILAQRGPRATLIVLPKWETVPDKARPGWVRVPGLLPPIDPGRTLAPSYLLDVTRTKSRHERLVTVQSPGAAEMQFFAPAVVQTISNPKLKPLVTDSSGRILLAQVENNPLLRAGRPRSHRQSRDGRRAPGQGRARHAGFSQHHGREVDRCSTSRQRPRAFAKPAQAGVRSAVSWRYADDFAALLLAAIHALMRFGSPRRSERAISFGKAALVDNSAALDPQSRP